MKFSKRSNDVVNPVRYEYGRALPVLLLILLLLVAAGGYLFFFTDLIIMHDRGNEPVASNASLVRKPLPPRPQNSEATHKEKTAAATQQEPVETKTKTGSIKPEPAMSSKQKIVHPAINTGNQVAAKTGAEKKLEKLTTARQIAKAVPEAKPAVATGKMKKAKVAKERHEAAGAAKPSIETATGPEKGRYTLLIGIYVIKKSMAAEKTKLFSAGLKPEISKGPKKMEPMNRLYVGRFDSYAEAALELKKIAKATKDAFILPEKGKFALYAGSYFEKGRAASEFERLSKAGFKSEIVQAGVPVSTFRLTAGSYASKEHAIKEAQRLKKLGLSPTVTGSGN